MGENRRDRFGLTIVEWVCPATDAGLSCLKRGGGAIWHLQLGQHLRDVVAHGLLRHAEPARDLMVAASGRDQLEYFAFARGQVGDSFPSRKTQPSRGTSVLENRSWRCAMLRPTPPTASPEDDRRVKRRSVRGWSAAVAVAAALAMTGGPASATIAETTHFTGTLHEAAENPCTGAPGTFDVTFVGIAHTTTNTDGTLHHVATVHGTESFTPADPAQPSYSGGFTARDGQNGAAGQTITETATFRDTLTAADGSKIHLHGTFHVTSLADGTVASSIDTVTLTCP
jgi:hypothetical protein